MAPVSSKEFFDTQPNVECIFTLKCLRDMMKTYSLNICSFLLVAVVVFCIFSSNELADTGSHNNLSHAVQCTFYLFPNFSTTC